MEANPSTSRSSSSRSMPAMPAMLMNCLFAMVFTGAAMGLLSSMGLLPKLEGHCAEAPYCGSSVVGDLRSLMSFVLGGVLCFVLARDPEARPQPFDGCNLFFQLHAGII
eukprot:CAMPEP_0170569764 /NCGR_PEP_ID=MMETSP0224-20130122/735_1 /TAXON_ID=285029 /ORGANISM="Togula jolla, Strain CCCM 725" /LENGTH=108 /DNA_ID=CAMNT_0010891965 /DNA_START=39 /DNA_END=365 /DNA_ORIENTATION=+